MTGAHSCFVVVVVDLAFALDLALDYEPFNFNLYQSGTPVVWVLYQRYGNCITY